MKRADKSEAGGGSRGGLGVGAEAGLQERERVAFSNHGELFDGLLECAHGL